MGRINIRFVTGAKHNPHIDARYVRVQNRAAAVLDAWDEVGEAYSIDVVAHMHRLSIDQIKKDLYGEPMDIKRRYGLKSTLKLERTLRQCLKELNDGQDHALVAVANHVPFMLLRTLQNNRNVKEVAKVFLADIHQKLVINNQENEKNTVESNQTCSTSVKLNRIPLSSIENQATITSSSVEVQTGVNAGLDCHGSFCSSQQLTTFDHPETETNSNCSVDSSLSSIRSNYDGPTEPNVSLTIDSHQQPITHSIHLHHQTSPFNEVDLKMDWKILHAVGVGLDNTNSMGICVNQCYVNAVIQCFAATAPFAQLLLDKNFDGQCDLSINGRFCSVCALQSVLVNIYAPINDDSIPSASTRYASAKIFSENIDKVSSTLTIGSQADPSEFLVFLLRHLANCLCSAASINEKSLTLIEEIFGLNVQRISRCNICSNEFTRVNWESILSVPIIGHSKIEEAVAAVFIEQQLNGENLYECTNCPKKVPGTTKLEILNGLNVLFIHLERFSYDENSKITIKVHQFISYPEILNLNPYLTKNLQQSNKENGKCNYAYQLYAVVVHSGPVAFSGHIFSYIRSPDGCWYEANDKSMTRSSSSVALHQKDAYILCYAKISTRLLSSSHNEAPKSSIGSLSSINTSTPIRSNQVQNNVGDHFNQINASDAICLSPNDLPQRHQVTFGPDATECYFIEKKKQFVNNSCFHEYSSSGASQSFTDNGAENEDIQADSRIEITRIAHQHDKGPRRTTTKTFDDSSTSEPDDEHNAHDDVYESKQDTTSPSRNTSSGIQASVINNDSQCFGEFTAQLSSNYQFKLQSVDLAKLHAIRMRKIEQKKRRLLGKMGLLDSSTISSPPPWKKIFLSKCVSNSNETMQSQNQSPQVVNQNTKKTNVDVEYLYVLLPYIKRFNMYCGLCVRNCTFGVTNANHRQLLRCTLRCSGNPDCPFKCSIIVTNDGSGHIIVINRTVRHVQGTKICRPTRAPLRSLLKKQFSYGASVYRVHHERLQKRTSEERKGRNYDGIGKSRNTLRKIKSEGLLESLLSPEVDHGLFKLLEKFRLQINSDGKVKGAIQMITKYPCQVIVFSESSIRLFDSLLKHKNVVLSWDATGSIIKEKNVHRLLYYELSITLPGIVNEDSIIPITFMISDAHALVNVTHWLELFKYNYAQIFVGKPFPQPRIVLSDRAMVFLLASLKVWNNETMSDFLNRSYRIVTNAADDVDHKKTNIHACLSHVLLDTRKIVNKYIPERFRDLAMWSISLLINTSTWNEFLHNWKLICLVFMQLHLDQEYIDKENYDALLNRIIQIQSDPNIKQAIKATASLQSDDDHNLSSLSVYDYDNDDDHIDVDLRSSGSHSRVKRRKVIIDEEQETLAADSPFKSSVIRIFHDVLTTCGIAINEIDKNSRGILRWFKYLTTSFMPMSPVWSNLLLGDLSRHRRRLVRSLETIIVNNEEQRTTGMSERRMGIVKRVQLGGEIHMRLDVLLSILVPDMLTMIEEYDNALMNYCNKSIDSSNANSTITFDEQRLKPIEERWREKISRRGRGHYAKAPDDTVLTDLLSCLLASQVNINENMKLPSVNPAWLDVAIGMVLSLGNSAKHRSPTLSSSNNDNYLLDIVTTFLDDWFNSSGYTSRSTQIIFKLPNNTPTSADEQSFCILDKILIPLLPCHLVVDKVYECKHCQSMFKIRSTITSIPISISKTGLHLERDFFDFFAPTSSDLNCSTCKRPTIRRIEVVQWPEVLIVQINDQKNIAKNRKPPGPLSLLQFSSWCSVGCPSAGVYDLVCFSSVLKLGDKSLLTRATKLKKSWLTSSHKRLIGEGEELRRLYANSRILIFKRMHHQKEFKFIHAIAQCALDKSLPPSIDIPSCLTVQDACSFIETHDDLQELKKALIGNINTYFYCNSCCKVPDSFRLQASQIFLFQLTPKNEVVARPICFSAKNQIHRDKECSFCGHVPKEVEMHVCKQVFVECPICLIRFADRHTEMKELFSSTIKLTDKNNVVHCYRPTSILLTSRYSDTATIIKYEKDAYIQYNADDYSKSVPLPISRMQDLFDTCGHILVFYRHVSDSNTQSQMGIVSLAEKNGEVQVVIQAGDRQFFIRQQRPIQLNK